MKEVRTKPYSFPYSVIDLEKGPVISWATFTLSLSFIDFLGENREIEFHDVTHFELVSEDEFDSRFFRNDEIVEVIDSPIIAKLIDIGEIHKDDAFAFRHIVIGFNEIGSYLVVIFLELEIISDD